MSAENEALMVGRKAENNGNTETEVLTKITQAIRSADKSR